MEIEKYYLFFENYANSFIQNATNETQQIHLKRKKEHSYRVVNVALRIGKSLNLNEYDMNIINIIALLHDLGRFPQFEKYETYDDSISENHAILSIKCIDESKILSGLNYGDIQLIKKCILLHNEKKLPNDLNDKEVLLSNILRDADKLDFFYGMVDIIPKLSQEEQKVFYSNKIQEPNVSDIVYDKIMNKEIILNNEIKTKLDKQVRSLGFITSDLNYYESFVIVMENNYIDRIYDMLPKIEKVNNIYKMIKEYMFNKLNQKK